MTNATKAYEDARSRAKKAIEEARAVVQEAFNEGAQSLLDELESKGVKSFSWTQYTPYFNDGDVCEFNAHVRWPEVNGYNEDDEYEEDEDENNEETTDIWESYSYEERRPIVDKIADFLTQFDTDDYLWMFGDHSRVTVSRSGTNVEDYEHD